MIKNIIFDFGGVILDFSKKHTLGFNEGLGVVFDTPTERIKELISSYRDDLLVGKYDVKFILGFLKEKLGVEKSAEELHKEFEKIHSIEYENINWELVSFIEELKQKYKLYILSDAFNLGWDNPHYLEVVKLFDDVFNSYKTGFRKPDQGAYMNVLSKIEAKPEECIFIDDTLKNVEAAEKLGIRSYLYTDFKNLEEDLRLSKLID